MESIAELHPEFEYEDAEDEDDRAEYIRSELVLFIALNLIALYERRVPRTLINSPEIALQTLFGFTEEAYRVQ